MIAKLLQLPIQLALEALEMIKKLIATLTSFVTRTDIDWMDSAYMIGGLV